MTPLHLPTRKLPDAPDLRQLKRQAKELLDAFARGDADAVREADTHYRDADRESFALHHAQLVLARAYGFDSWPKLKAFVDGATTQRLVDAIRARRLDDVKGMLAARPELSRMGIANFGPLHYAVLENDAEAVRLLMASGANAHEGVYPHRDATTPYALAKVRGYTDIVRIIEAQEQNRRDTAAGTPGTPAGVPLFRAILERDVARVSAILDATPALVHTRHETFGHTALHLAAHQHQSAIVTLLLERGADPAARAHQGWTPLDAAAHAWYNVDRQQFRDVTTILVDRGATMTAAAAAALGDTAWLLARHAEGTLRNQNDDAGGLLRIAVTHDQPDVLCVLLDCGFDPDERIRIGEAHDAPESWGMPLQACASSGKYDMAELLLQRGADPNARIYASGDPVFSAYDRQDARMIALLERYGGIPAATTAGLFRQTDLARRMLSGEAPYRLDGVGGDQLAEQLLWGAACGGDPEIVRLALERVEWRREDPRWFEVLEQTLRNWSRLGSVNAAGENVYLVCLRLVLQRCDPNLRGRPTDNQQFGLTTLHNLVARGDMPADDRARFATVLLDAGARLDIRDNLLKSTPLAWACRWGVVPLIGLFLERGADPIERDAEPWATPRAWAERMNRPEVLAMLASR